MPNRIAQIGGTLGRAYMKDRDRRRREKVEDYAYDSRVAKDDAEKAAMQKQEQLAPLVSSYVQALQTGDKEQASMAYQNLVTRLDDPEQMAKFSQMHQQFLQRVDEKRKGLSDAKYKASYDARGRGLKISGYDEYGNPTGHVPMTIDEMSPTERAEWESKKALAKRYMSEGNKSKTPKDERMEFYREGLKRYNQLQYSDNAYTIENDTPESFANRYADQMMGNSGVAHERAVKGNRDFSNDPANKPVSRTAPNRISSANVSVDVPSAPQESTRIATAQSEVGAGNKGSVPPEVKQELMQIAQDIKTQKQDPRTIEEIYQEELANWLSAQGK